VGGACWTLIHTYSLNSIHREPLCRSDLNALLANWNNVGGCTGSIAFTATTPKTYVLTDEYFLGLDASWAWDGSSSAGVTIVGAFNKHMIISEQPATVVLKGLTFRATGSILSPYHPISPDGHIVCMNDAGTFMATDCVFLDGIAEDGGATFHVNGGYVSTVIFCVPGPRSSVPLINPSNR
jgi:hypothetical protein